MRYGIRNSSKNGERRRTCSGRWWRRTPLFARDKHHGVRKQDQTYTVELIVKEVDSSIDALQHLLETLLRATEALKNKRKTVKSGNVETLLSLFKTALETEPPERGYVVLSKRRGWRRQERTWWKRAG